MTTRTDVLRVPEVVDLPMEARQALLALARTAVGVAARALPTSDLQAPLPRGLETEVRAAAFVTLTGPGGLRGCVGMLDATRPIVEAVIEAAACATRTDPRFPPVQPQELEDLEIEVSVLGPTVPIDDPLSFRLGIDGILVERDGLRGLLLPEVAPMVGFDRVEMLDIACRKAGLPSGAWRDPRTTVSVFRTIRFGGPALIAADAIPTS